MQRIATYRMDSAEIADRRTLAERADVVRSLVDIWMRDKGANGDGTYIAKDDSNATYQRVSESYQGKSWEFVELIETNDVGRRFSAGVSITVTESQVLVFVTLELGSESSQVNAVPVDTRCPKIVRSLLLDAGPWFHGSTELVGFKSVKGFESGEDLAVQLLAPARRVPIVVVATSGSTPTLTSGLAKNIAHDLAGLANVVEIDADASWALTNELGRRFSCHSGAVRIYWPGFNLASDPYRHPLWTGRRIFSQRAGVDPVHLLRQQLRSLVMSASAVSAVRPVVIDEIRSGASAQRFQKLRDQAESVADFSEIANLYSAENAELRERLQSIEKETDNLADQLRSALADRAALAYQLRSLSGGIESGSDGIEPDFDGDQVSTPTAGEIRFYKKVHSTPSHDVLKPVQDCGHSKWQNSAKADKAKKGLEKLEGRSDWGSLQHCGVCTGGGVWRVRW